ncbi:MAG: nucleotidyltransferase domain-containing protein [Candidatus Omnitrophota bacterium]|nr:nucleotidyltransferase domain-containing protein [Candidatus Omnitrophota bacterium]
MNALALQRRNILNKELKRIADIIIKKYSPQKIILFGSLASGNVHEWSDIDLVVIKDTQTRFLDRTEELLLLSRPRVGINIVVYTPYEAKKMIEENRYFFVDEILKKGMVLYERDKQLV